MEEVEGGGGGKRWREEVKDVEEEVEEVEGRSRED